MERGSYVQIASGEIFDPLNPDPDKITLEVLAQALSNQCRFTGHTGPFYSVAEHSVHVSRACDPADAPFGVMHDTPEFALGDLSSPLKGSEYGAAYLEAEANLWRVIADKFGVPHEMPPSVKEADENMREIERLRLLPRTPEGDELWAEWPADTSRIPEHCWPQCWPPAVAKVLFLDRCREVGL